MDHYLQEHFGIAAAGRQGLSSHLYRRWRRRHLRVRSVWISDVRWVSIHCPGMVVFDRLLDESLADDWDDIMCSNWRMEYRNRREKKDQPLTPRAIHILRTIGFLIGVFARRN